jgi:hypothetical protein
MILACFESDLAFLADCCMMTEADETLLDEALLTVFSVASSVIETSAPVAFAAYADPGPDPDPDPDPNPNPDAAGLNTELAAEPPDSSALSSSLRFARCGVPRVAVGAMVRAEPLCDNRCWSSDLPFGTLGRAVGGKPGGVY